MFKKQYFRANPTKGFNITKQPLLSLSKGCNTNILIALLARFIAHTFSFALCYLRWIFHITTS